METQKGLRDFSTIWIRYDQYDIRQTAEGYTYILPAEGAVFTLYDPFEQGEQLLAAILSLGQTAEKYGLAAVETEAALLGFAQQYGLLGLVTTGVYNRDILGEEMIWLSERHVTGGKGMVNGEAYWRQFAPFAYDDELQLKQHKRGIELRKAEDSPKFFGKRPLVMDLVFSRFYGEQIQWIVTFAQKLVKHFEMLLVYRENRDELTEPVEIMPEFFQPERISFTVQQGQRTRLNWQVDGLRTVIEIIYGLMVTEEDMLLKRCPYCGKFFIAKSRKEKYCSQSCRNCANVIKSRKRRIQEEDSNG